MGARKRAFRHNVYVCFYLFAEKTYADIFLESMSKRSLIAEIAELHANTCVPRTDLCLNMPAVYFF